MKLTSPSLLFWACLIIPTTAKICEFPPRNNFRDWYTTLESQEQADNLLQDCTTVIGSLNVSTGYVGSLVISGVTNLTGTVNFFGSEMTEMVWTDLEYLSDFNVQNMTALHSVSFPKLSNVTNILILYAQRIEIDFPVLTHAEDVQLKGSIASLNAPLLSNVSSISMGYYSYWQASDVFDGYNFSLPSLEYIDDYLSLSGNLTDVVLPKLKMISPPKVPQVTRGGYNPDTPYAFTSQIILNPPRNINLPSLKSADKLSVNCRDSISLPVLERVTELTLDVENSTAVILPALWNATTIKINGAVTDVSFPALNETDLITVEGTGPIATNCTTVTADWARTNTTERYSVYKKCMSLPGTAFCKDFSCRWYNYKAPQGNSKKNEFLKVNITGLVSGVVIGVVLILLALLWWKEKAKRRKAVAAAAQREGEIEMDGVTIMGDGESVERVQTVDLVERRRDSKDTVVVVGVEERAETSQRS